jgi:hypothetical protein
MKSHKSVRFQGDVFSRTSRESLPPTEKIDRDAEDRKSVLAEWTNDHEAQKLVKLAYALGVGEIILAIRDIDKAYFQGQYISVSNWRVFHELLLKPWHLSPRQLATVNRTLRNNSDVILLSYESDFAETLAHELGHYINHRLGGLSELQLEFPVTENMRRVARFDEYFFQNKDEFYAETWSRFLCGERNRALFRYLKRPIDRLRMKHPQKTRLILELAKRGAN